jgi:YVTN family beta-propeller protein
MESGAMSLTRRLPVLLAAALGAAAILSCESATSAGGAGTTIEVTPDAVTLAPGLERALAVSVFDGEGTLLVGVPVTFRSADTTVATISTAGVIRAVGPVAQTTVTVKSGSASTTVPVVVVPLAPTTISVSPPTVAMPLGDSVQLTATVYDQAGNVFPGATVGFASSDTMVVTVSAAGMVHGVRVGVGTVTASSGTARGRVPVQVQPLDSVVATIAVPGSAYGIDVSSAGVVYATLASGSHLARISLATRSLVDTVPVGSAPTGVAFSPDGATAYVTNQLSGTLGVVDVATDSEVAEIPIDANPFVTLPSPDGSKVVVTGNDDRIFFVDPVTRTVTAGLQVGSAPNGLAFNAAGTRLYVSNAYSGTVVEVDPATPAVLRTFAVGGRPQGLALSADGSELYVANEYGWLGVYSVASGARTDSVPLDGAAFGLARSPDDSVLYVGVLYPGEIEIVQRATHAVVGAIPTAGVPRRIAFSPDGRHAVIANEDGWVSVVAR